VIALGGRTLSEHAASVASVAMLNSFRAWSDVMDILRSRRWAQAKPS
jgi:hypothetical protein